MNELIQTVNFINRIRREVEPKINTQLEYYLDVHEGNVIVRFRYQHISNRIVGFAYTVVALDLEQEETLELRAQTIARALTDV